MTRRPQHRQQGTSLIEALVALLVLALGVMGMAAIQTRSLATARSSNLRAVAIRAVEDLQERMQANSDLRVVPAVATPYVTTWGPPPAAQTDCNSVSCTGAQLAAFDLVQWKNELSRSLPSGDGMVFASAKDVTQLGILVAWKENQAQYEAQVGDKEAVPSRQPTAAQGATDPTATGVSGELCPATLTCHLSFVRP